jgi:hypothetical protein
MAGLDTRNSTLSVLLGIVDGCIPAHTGALTDELQRILGNVQKFD